MTTASTYFASPELYDRMYAGFVADIPIHVDEARAAGGATLEVCCGNGRLLVPIREAGADIDGLDADPPLLDDLRRKLAERGLSTQLHLGDMRDFHLPRRYALVFIGFNSFGHNLTQEDQLRTLRCCREHLARTGHLTLVVFHPSASKLARYDGTPFVSIERPEPDGGQTRVWDEVQSDRVEQVNRVTRRVERLGGEGEILESREVAFTFRYVYKPEMELLLRLAGFARWDTRSLFSGYSGERFATPRPPQDGGVLVWRAWAD